MKISKIFCAALSALTLIISLAACKPATAPSSTTTGGNTSGSQDPQNPQNPQNAFDPSTIPVPADSEFTQTITNTAFSPSDGNWTYILVTENTSVQISTMLGSSSEYSNYTLNTTAGYQVLTFSITSGTVSDTITEYTYSTGTISGGPIQPIKQAVKNYFQTNGTQATINDDGSFVLYRVFSAQDIQDQGQADVPRATINGIKNPSSSSLLQYTITANSALTKYKLTSSSNLFSNIKWYFVKQ